MRLYSMVVLECWKRSRGKNNGKNRYIIYVDYLYVQSTIFSFNINLYNTKGSILYSMLWRNVVFNSKVNIASTGLDNFYGSLVS